MLFEKKETKVIFVDEMHCNHCTKRVEDTLNSIKGVKSAKADLENKSCTVVFVPEKVSVDQMCKALSEIGFPSRENND